MKRRQTTPAQWLIVNRLPDAKLRAAARHLPPGNGVLVLHRLMPGDRRWLRHVAAQRGLIVFDDSRLALRVHNQRELTAALLRRPLLVLVSPIHRTRSHPDWRPLPRMRAATLARLANRRAIALGGMDEQRFRRVQRLGFVGWAGISAFRI